METSGKDTTQPTVSVTPSSVTRPRPFMHLLLSSLSASLNHHPKSNVLENFVRDVWLFLLFMTIRLAMICFALVFVGGNS